MKTELKKAQIEVFQNESGLPSQSYGQARSREGVDFIIKTNTANIHEVYLQPINLDIERKVKIPKLTLGEPKDNLWVALVLIIGNKAINFYLIIHCFLLFLREFMNASHFLLK